MSGDTSQINQVQLQANVGETVMQLVNIQEEVGKRDMLHNKTKPKTKSTHVDSKRQV